MSDDWQHSMVERLVGMGFTREDAECTAAWVGLTGRILGEDPERNHPVLRAALVCLGKRAEHLYPGLLAGEAVTMGVDDLEGWTLPTDVGRDFVKASGDMLFSGSDGPRATVLHMIEKLDHMAEYMATDDPERREELLAEASSRIDHRLKGE